MSSVFPPRACCRLRADAPAAGKLPTRPPVSLLAAVGAVLLLSLALRPAQSGESTASEPAASEPGIPTLEEAQELLVTGRYAECSAAAARALEDGPATESWYLLKLRSELAVGDYPSALATLEDALLDHRYSIRLRWEGLPLSNWGDDAEGRRALMLEIEDLVKRMARRYRDPENRVIVGRFLLKRGLDPRAVLEQVYDPLEKEAPESIDASVASGDLALEKQDYAVAAEEYSRALKLDPGNPDVLLGLAKALAPSDPAAAREHLQAALERNPNHKGSLLFLIDHAVDREAYDEARDLIERVLDIDPGLPAAHAYRAVLAHIRGDYAGEKAARAKALARWATNPEVDWLIGRKLSQKYRFREGAVYQRRALAMDRTYLPALMQLSQDLLRLGKEEEGWRLAREVSLRDGYNVVAHNLSQLHDHMEQFRTLEGDGLLVRMDPREAAIYGERVLDLLRQARQTLCAKYEISLEEPVVVEVFPERQDFAIRTFGLPGGEGFLGVCFGNVITANSPAALARSPTSWEAILWHEFCHVVTLHKTRNRMPRWLSEGISVYEEKLRDPSWGQQMIPAYLDLIQAEGVLPMNRLSGAFLNPPSALHLQYAYYQSSLVVEFVIENRGLDAMRGLLSDLAEGRPIDIALEERMGSPEKLDRDVSAFVLERAAELEAQADWEAPELPEDADAAALAKWLEEHPDSFRGLERQAALLLEERQWAEARKPLEKLLELCPECTQPGNAYEALARVQRELGDVEAEKGTLEKLSELDADAVAPRLRLLELCREDRDWKGLARTAERLLAVNPLLEVPHRALVRAREELGSPAEALSSYRALLRLEPMDPADLHYRLGRLLRSEGKLEEAKRQLLQSLEEAPRFREAHRELLAVVRDLKGEALPAPEALGSSGESPKGEEES